MRERRGWLRGSGWLLVLTLASFTASAASATPVVVEAGWQLVRTVAFSDPNAAVYNPVDGKLYVNKLVSNANGGGVWRIEDDGTATRIARESRPRGLVVDPATGDLFFSTAGNPQIFRVDPTASAAGCPSADCQLWTSGFGQGLSTPPFPADSDPIGLALVPEDWAGNILIDDGMGGTIALAPGMALVADEGNSSPNAIWAWNVGTPEGELLVSLDSQLGVPVDVAFTHTDAWVADLNGFVFRILSDGSMSVLSTSISLESPVAIVADPLTGDLFVLDQSLDKVLRIDPETGTTTTVIEGLTVGNAITDTAGLDVSPDGTKLIVTDRGADEIYVFSLVPEPAVVMMLGAGLAGLAWSGRKRARA